MPNVVFEILKHAYAEDAPNSPMGKKVHDLYRIRRGQSLEKYASNFDMSHASVYTSLY